MSKQRGPWPFVIYFIILNASVVALWGTLQLGEHLVPTTATANTNLSPASFASAFADFQQSVTHHRESTIGRLLLQILVILIAARLMGWLFRKIKQPAVIGEIVAGILLGPSLFGKLSPELFTMLFPQESLPNIQLLSNFGLILFMFAVGMELRLGDIRRQLKGSIVISHAGILLPFVLSLPLSYSIYTQYAAAYTDFTPFALFIGIAMSITAFPVLARIIQESNLQRTHLGKLSLSTAAAGDITAWLMLAAIIAISQSGSILSTGYNLLFLIGYLLVMFGIIRPLFRAAGKVYNNTEVISHGMVGVIIILLLLSSYITELLSMHALFGAFMLGLVMPEDLSFRKIISDKIEDVSLLLFLPLFFVSSGLQTELGLISGVDMWTLLGAFTLIAIVGKVGGTYISARVCGQSPKNSIYLGAFMNTRGLMELVVLGIGYEMGILPPAIYTVLVMMTVITTVMTMPMIHLVNLINKLRTRRTDRIDVVDKQAGAKVLLSFGRPASGASLLRLTNQLLRRGEAHPNVTALHITTDKDINSIDADKYFNDSFRPIIMEANRLAQPLETDYQVSGNVENTILAKLINERYNLLIVGAGVRLSSDEDDREATTMREQMSRRMGAFSVRTTEALLSIHSMLRDKMEFFIEKAPCSVGIFLSRSFDSPKRILLYLTTREDIRMLPYARTMAENNQGTLHIIISKALQGEKLPLHLGEEIIAETLPHSFVGTAGEPDTHSEKGLSPNNGCKPPEGYDLMILSYGLWRDTFDHNKALLLSLPSTLILNLK